MAIRALGARGLFTLFTLLSILSILSSPLLAQSAAPPPAPPPLPAASAPAASTPAAATFEVADVHASPFDRNLTLYLDMQGGNLSGDRYIWRQATMTQIIAAAYNLEPANVQGGPSWLDWDRYDIVAKAPPTTSKAEIRAHASVAAGAEIRPCGPYRQRAHAGLRAHCSERQDQTEGIGGHGRFRLQGAASASQSGSPAPFRRSWSSATTRPWRSLRSCCTWQETPLWAIHPPAGRRFHRAQRERTTSTSSGLRANCSLAPDPTASRSSMP